MIVDGVQTQELRALTGVLEHMGVSLYQEPELIYVHSGQRLRAVSVKPDRIRRFRPICSRF